MDGGAGTYSCSSPNEGCTRTVINVDGGWLGSNYHRVWETCGGGSPELVGTGQGFLDTQACIKLD